MRDTVQPTVQWMPAYDIGIPQIDGEHRKLFALAERLHQAMLDGKGKTVLVDLLARLVEYAGEHFAHEEQLMRRIGYPCLPQHQRQHLACQSRLTAMQARASAGEGTMTIEVMQFLLAWIAGHIEESDQGIAAYMETSGQVPR